MRVCELDTPVMLVDLDVMDRNLRRVADYARDHGLRLRPHTKTHKTPWIARKQLDLGAAGLTVAKVGEAEVMLAATPPDLLVAYPVIGRSKLDRLTAVARSTHVTVSLDSLIAAQQLSDAARAGQVDLGVLVEVDVGLNRVGASPGAELLDLARAVQRLPAISLQGIAFYPGHIRDVGEQGKQALAELNILVQDVLTSFHQAGVPLPIVSGGSTPSLFHSHQIRGLTEIRPGTYVFNDRNTVLSGACTLDDCAASILVTVVSTARPGQIIVDGGSKTFASDLAMEPAAGTFGEVLEAPAARIYKMNEEHGFVDVTRTGQKFQVGDQLRIVPNHVCVAMNLHERVFGIRGGEVEQVWEVAGRGKLQ